MVIEVFERTDVVVEAVGTPPCCWVAQVARVVGESESSFGGEPVTVNVRFQDMSDGEIGGKSRLEEYCE